MRVICEMRLDGKLLPLSVCEKAPAKGMAFRADGRQERTLYVDGVRVGCLLGWPDEEGTHVRTGGGKPDQFLVSRTRFEAALDLPAYKQPVPA